MKKINKNYLISLAIIMLQIVVMLYWLNAKTNFFIDEFYSMGYASSFTGTGDAARYITTSPEWKFDEWVDNSVYKKYLVVSDQEQMFSVPFSMAVKKLLTGANYEGFLNIAESVAGNNCVTAWPGFWLNIFFFIFTEIALLILMRKLKMKFWTQCFALAMFGFSGYVISLVIYIRFYMLVVMYLLLMLNLFFIVWVDNRLQRFIPAEMGILILTYLAYKNSELMVAYFGAISFCMIIALLIAKKWRQFISYVFIGSCGVAYILLRTNYIDVLLHPADYSVGNSMAVNVSLRMSETSIGEIKSYAGWVSYLLSEYYCGDFIIILVAVFVLTVYSIWKYSRREEGGSHEKLMAVKPITLISMFIWIGLLLLSYFMKHKCISICIAVILLLSLYAVFEMFGFQLKRYSIRLNQETGFVAILLGTTAIYTAFAAMAGFTTWRYYCFGFVTLIIIFWYVLDRILKRLAPLKMERGWYHILGAFVLLSAFTPFITRKVECVYENDKNLKEQVEQYEKMDVVLVSEIDETNAISRHETYDCVNQMSGESRIYAFDINSYSYDDVAFPDEFLLWSLESRDISDVLHDLAEHGFEIKNLGKNHVSQVYVCK